MSQDTEMTDGSGSFEQSVLSEESYTPDNAAQTCQRYEKMKCGYY